MNGNSFPRQCLLSVLVLLLAQYAPLSEALYGVGGVGNYYSTYGVGYQPFYGGRSYYYGAAVHHPPYYGFAHFPFHYPAYGYGYAFPGYGFRSHAVNGFGYAHAYGAAYHAPYGVGYYGGCWAGANPVHGHCGHYPYGGGFGHPFAYGYGHFPAAYGLGGLYGYKSNGGQKPLIGALNKSDQNRVNIGRRLLEYPVDYAKQGEPNDAFSYPNQPYQMNEGSWPGASPYQQPLFNPREDTMQQYQGYQNQDPYGMNGFSGRFQPYGGEMNNYPPQDYAGAGYQNPNMPLLRGDKIR